MLILNKLKEIAPHLAVLIDPDKANGANYMRLLDHLESSLADLVFVGGSTLMDNNVDRVISEIKSRTTTPVILFPGSGYQLSPLADGVLMLSLISGRNPDYLIGRQVEAAPLIKKLNIESIPTGYMLVGDDQNSGVSYMSQTRPIPESQKNIIVSTALAGELLGMTAIYMEAGSGSKKPIDSCAIQEVSKAINATLIVGGGIDNEERCNAAIHAGADVVVVGTAIEKNPDLLIDLAILVKKYQASHA